MPGRRQHADQGRRRAVPIDPCQIQSTIDALAAQLKLEETRLAQKTQLARTNAGRSYDVEQREASVDKLRAQIRARSGESST